MIEAITLKGANVSAFQDAMIHDAVFKQNGVFRYGSNLEAVIKTNNLVSLKDGIFVFQGRYARIKSGATEDVRIKNSRSGVTRKDLIVLHFETDGFTEKMDIRCITGEENGNVPAHATGDSLAGTTTVEMPLYVVSLNGLSIESVTRQFDYIEPIGGCLRGLAPTNLLINGDFQCNQRGQADYNITAGWKYTLDMWKAYNLYLNTKNKGVISISVPTSSIGYFVQHLDETKNGDFTFVVNVPLIHRGTISVYLEGAGTEKFTISKSGIHTHTFRNVTGATKLSMELNNFYGDFKYVDLFEGDVAYPHVKEDYALAISRCRKYLRYINLIGNQYTLISGGKEAWVMFQFDNYAGMKATPTLSTKKVGIVNISGGGTLTSGPIITPWRAGGTSKVKIDDPSPTAKFLDNMHYPVHLDAFLTCEPL